MHAEHSACNVESGPGVGITLEASDTIFVSFVDLNLPTFPKRGPAIADLWSSDNRIPTTVFLVIVSPFIACCVCFVTYSDKRTDNRISSSLLISSLNRCCA